MKYKRTLRSKTYYMAVASYEIDRPHEEIDQEASAERCRQREPKHTIQLHEPEDFESKTSGEASPTEAQHKLR